MKRHLRDQLIVSMVVLVLVPSAFYFVYTLKLLNPLLAGQSEARLEELAWMAKHKVGEEASAGGDRAAVAASLRQFIPRVETYLLDTAAIAVHEQTVLLQLNAAEAVLTRRQWEWLHAGDRTLIVSVALAVPGERGFSYHPYRVAFRPVGPGWLLVLAHDEAAAEAVRREVMLGAIQWSGVFVALALLLALLLSGRFTRPILQLQRWAEASEQGAQPRPLKIARGDELGQLARSLAAMADRIEAQIGHLTELKKYNECIIDSMLSGVITLEPDGRVRACNRRALDILGLALDPPRCRQRHHRELFAGYPALLGVMDETLRRHGSFHREELGETRADGAKLMLGLSSNQLLDETGALLGVAFFFQDLTAIKGLERKVRDQEKLAALGQLAAVVAHEVRNPLNPIKGFAQLLLDETDPAEVRQAARIIVNQVETLQQVVDNLLLYTRPGEVAWTRVAPAALAGEVLALYRREIADGQFAVRCEIDPGLHWRSGALQLRLVLDNLIRNALALLPPGGALTLAARTGPAGLVLTVTDNGPGMTPAVQARLFESFFTTRATGTGLGLAVVKKLVGDLGGTISVASTPGQGTTFTITLPGSAPPGAAAPSPLTGEAALVVIPDRAAGRHPWRLGRGGGEDLRSAGAAPGAGS